MSVLDEMYVRVEALKNKRDNVRKSIEAGIKKNRELLKAGNFSGDEEEASTCLALAGDLRARKLFRDMEE